MLLTINNPTPEYNDSFGISVVDTADGNVLVGADHDNTGALQTGSVYLFDGNDGSLLLTINNPTPERDDFFGRYVATTSTGNILVGAYRDDTGAEDTGSVYLFDGTDGSLLLTINNPTPSHNDGFGYFVTGTLNGNMLISAPYDNMGAQYSGSVYLFRGILSEPAPIITSLVIDDPDDLDNIYSIDDTITITFDSVTNMPGGTDRQLRTAVNDLFTFTESIGQAYNGKWSTPDTFTITIKNTNNAALIIGNTTVTPTGITPILSSDGSSESSTSISPALTGDFGTGSPSPSNDWVIDEGVIYYNAGNVGIGIDNPNSNLDISGYIELGTISGIPPVEDCDNADEIGRMKIDDSTTDLYICTSSGWVTK